MDIGEIYEAIKRAEKDGEAAVKMEKQSSKKRISSERRRLEAHYSKKLEALKKALDDDISSAEESCGREADTIRSEGARAIEAMKAEASGRMDRAVEKVIERLIEE